MRTRGFKITAGKGFHVTFENGITVSVQWGPGNYCDNYDERIDHDSDVACGKRGSDVVETAVIRGKNLIEVPMWPGDTVQPHMSPEDVLNLLNWAAALEE